MRSLSPSPDLVAVPVFALEVLNVNENNFLKEKHGEANTHFHVSKPIYTKTQSKRKEKLSLINYNTFSLVLFIDSLFKIEFDTTLTSNSHHFMWFSALLQGQSGIKSIFALHLSASVHDTNILGWDLFLLFSGSFLCIETGSCHPKVSL